MITYWATLWYAGAVVITMGYEGQTLDQCEILSEIILADVVSAYEDDTLELELTMFPTNEFSVSCEDEMLSIDERYMK